MKNKIENIADLQVGDVEALLSYRGHKFGGDVWGDNTVLLVGSTVIRMHGEAVMHIQLHHAYRDVPNLPTHFGAKGTATVRGVPNQKCLRALQGVDVPYAWLTQLPVDGIRRHADSDIADFVPDEPERVAVFPEFTAGESSDIFSGQGLKMVSPYWYAVQLFDAACERVNQDG